jgi:hypothetical protein
VGGPNEPTLFGCYPISAGARCQIKVFHKALEGPFFVDKAFIYLDLGLLRISSLQIVTHIDKTKVCTAQKSKKLSPSFLLARKKIKLMKMSRLICIGDVR